MHGRISIIPIDPRADRREVVSIAPYTKMSPTKRKRGDDDAGLQEKVVIDINELLKSDTDQIASAGRHSNDLFLKLEEFVNKLGASVQRVKEEREREKQVGEYARKPCSHEGCTNQSAIGGVCRRHGVKHKTCTHDGCTSIAHKGGVCVRHGAKLKKCTHEGCTNNAKRGGVCIRHGAKKPTCSHEGCTNNVAKGGVCIRHGAKDTKKKCSFEGCNNQVQKGGVCWQHGAKAEVEICSHDGCNNYAKKGGVCIRHGAKMTKAGKEEVEDDVEV